MSDEHTCSECHSWDACPCGCGWGWCWVCECHMRGDSEACADSFDPEGRRKVETVRPAHVSAVRLGDVGVFAGLVDAKPQALKPLRPPRPSGRGSRCTRRTVASSRTRSLRA